MPVVNVSAVTSLIQVASIQEKTMSFRKSLPHFLELFVLIGCSLFIGIGCGGGGGSGSSSTGSASESFIGQALLGPIVKGNAALYPYRNPGTPLWQGVTTDAAVLSDAGLIDLPKNIIDSLADDALYFLAVTGGSDIDADDNGVVDTTPTPNAGTVHLLAPGRYFKQQGKAGDPAFVVSALSAIMFEMLFPEGVDGAPEADVLTRYDQLIAGYLIRDVNGDSRIDMADVCDWNPAAHGGCISLSEDRMRDITNRIHRGEAIVHKITVSAGENGSVAPETAAVLHGGDQTVSITANAGYQIADVRADDISVGTPGSYTFTNVMAGHTISARFAVELPDSYIITASAGMGGHISPVGTVSVNHGARLTYTITADAGKQVADVLVDGVSVGAVATYTFTNVTASHTISASFTAELPDTHNITASAGTGGRISPSGTTAVSHGASQPYTITPNAGYHIEEVRVDGASVGAVGVYTFTNVTAAHTISASFAKDTYNITASAGTNGTVTPAGVTAVMHGSDQAYTITAAAGYHVANVLVDGTSIGAVTTYTFTNVTAGHSISASFSENTPLPPSTFTITASAGGNGTVTPAGESVVNRGASQGYTITPNAGYFVKDVRVDGVSVGPVPEYTFANVTAPHTISATFISYEEMAKEAGLTIYIKEDLNDTIQEPDSNLRYINNQVVLLFHDNTEQPEIDALLSSINASVGSKSDDNIFYRIVFNENLSPQEIDAVVDLLRSSPIVRAALKNYVNFVEPGSDFGDNPELPEDPWQYYLINDGLNLWDLVPEGSNWGLEFIHAPEAWINYNNQLGSVSIGVMDTGFTKHNDLSNAKVESSFRRGTDEDTDEERAHGNHVSGIIGADWNKSGINGILKKVSLHQYEPVTDEQRLLAVKNLKHLKVRVLNHSMGTNWEKDLPDQLHEFEAELKNGTLESFDFSGDLKNLAEIEANLVSILSGDDILITQSAGNDNINAKYNGAFVSLWLLDTEKVSRLRNNIIVVGNADMSISGKRGNHRIMETAFKSLLPGQKSIATG